MNPATASDNAAETATVNHGAQAGADSSSRIFVWIMVGLYGAVIVAIYRNCVQLTRNTWVYPIDDQYIGMSVAKNFALHGVWGVTRYAFTSCTSTPLFTLLTAAVFRVIGVVDWVPLVLACGAGAVALVIADRLFAHCPAPLRAAALAAMCFLTSLPALGLLGMEHTLHITLVLLFLLWTLQRWDEPDAFDWKLLILVVLIVGVRYESMFIVATTAAAFAIRRRFRLAAGLVGFAAVPVLAFGLVSVLHGWTWLPASVAIRGAPLPLSRHAASAMIFRIWVNLQISSALVALMIAVVLVGGYRYRRLPGSVRYIFWLTVIVWTIHMVLAQAGSMYRYEGYLIALAVAALALILNECHDVGRSELAVCAIVMLAATVPLAMRFAEAAAYIPRASHGVYTQQYQMAEFLRRYYNGAAVVAHDIGAINYLADIDCIDMAGLGNRELFHVWYAQKTKSDLDAQRAVLPVILQETAAHQAKIAVFYDSWFPALAQSWPRAASWKVADKADLGSDFVTFFAIDPAELPRLRQALIDFAPSMPGGVKVIVYQDSR